MIYRVKNWKKFQHFKDRRPPWIKLYRDLLDDPDWYALSPAERDFLVLCWLVASEAKERDGRLPDARKLAFRIRMQLADVERFLLALPHWLEPDDINLISS